MNEIDAKRLIAFMAHFFYNCATDISFAERVEEWEPKILADFQACSAETGSSEFVLAAYECASKIQENRA